MKLEELSRILRETDPAAVLVDRRVLDRVIQNVTGIAWVVWQVPHGHCFVVDRSTLYKYVEPEELNLPHDYNLPAAVLRTRLRALRRHLRDMHESRERERQNKRLISRLSRLLR